MFHFKSAELIKLQYSQYSDVPVAVAQPTGQPEHVVGGEPGGRGAVVVNQQAHGGHPLEIPPEAATTSALGNKAAPGHDVFAGDEEKEARRESASISQAAEEPLDMDDKIVSTVVVFEEADEQLPQHGDHIVTEEIVVTHVVEAEETSTSIVYVDETVGVDAEDPNEVEHVLEENSHKAEEPLDQDGTEAEIIRNELFPEEADA